jgi:hypothetical protein
MVCVKASNNEAWVFKIMSALVRLFLLKRGWRIPNLFALILRARYFKNGEYHDRCMRPFLEDNRGAPTR